MRPLAIWIVLLVLPAPSLAQLCTPGLLPQRQYPDPPAGVPFLATVKTTCDRILGDGNTLHGVSQVRIARGADGRLYRETYVRCAVGKDSQPHVDYNVFLSDTRDNTVISWAIGEDALKKAVFNHILTPSTEPAPAPARDPTQRASLLQSPAPAIEPLGSRNIQGLEVQGTRVTTTYPSANTTNTRPIVVTEERWVAANGLVLVQIDDDPRQGRVTLELQGLRLGAPDPALFEPPAEYLIEDHTPQPHP